GRDPIPTNGQQKTGDVYKCPVTSDSPSNCTKLNLGRVTLSNVSERKDNMRLGLSLATNPKDSSFLVRAEGPCRGCGSSYYTTGMCSRVNANFRFAKTVAPALQRCQTYMDIIIVLDGSNSIYPWVEVQHFLINILKKFYIGPGQIQVGVVQYGEDVVHEFHLNDYRSVKDVVAAASHIEQRGGTETRTAYGIEFARSEAFQKGGRKGAKRVMIVITDGESHDSPDLEKVIEDSEKDNVTRYAVAVLGYYNRRGINPEAFLNEIKFIASDPDDKHFFNVTDEAALKDIVDALGERIFSLEGTNKNEISFGLEMSQTGFSSHIVEDGILLGAVGAYDWNGAVLKETSSGKVIPLRESYLQEFPEELKNHGAYLGYTVSSVVSTARERLYVAGAPRFNHTGKVIIFTMHNNRNLTIHQALKGEQIGSYYGSEINSLDVNGDGVTDVLLVGAPMYFSEGRERGKVYVYALRENRFVSSGALGDLQGYQNSRFGSCIAAVPDLNQDSYNDVVVGAPLEDDHQGAIYIFLGFQETVLKKYKQRIAAADLGPGLMYFGCSIHGQLDMNEDGLVDLAVGSLGNAVLLWSRSVVQINASIRFEPSKINIFTKDCKRNGKDATCMSAFICFTAVFLSAHFQTASVGKQRGCWCCKTPKSLSTGNASLWAVLLPALCFPARFVPWCCGGHRFLLLSTGWGPSAAAPALQEANICSKAAGRAQQYLQKGYTPARGYMSQIFIYPALILLGLEVPGLTWKVDAYSKEIWVKGNSSQVEFPRGMPLPSTPRGISAPCQQGGRTGGHKSPIFSPGSVHRRCEDGESPEPPCSRCSAALQCHH
uniref:Integrin subunit alpha 11 n=1 Tax=Anas platyrhynchos TaxID=8839 RepID=A0A8B9SHB5_ANAPL